MGCLIDAIANSILLSEAGSSRVNVVTSQDNPYTNFLTSRCEIVLHCATICSYKSKQNTLGRLSEAVDVYTGAFEDGWAFSLAE